MNRLFFTSSRIYLAAGIFALFAALFGAMSAAAASAYDDAYQTTDSLFYSNASLCPATDDIAGTWQDLVADPDNWNHTPADYALLYPILQQAMASGSYSVTQFFDHWNPNNSNYPMEWVEIVFSPDQEEIYFTPGYTNVTDSYTITISNVRIWSGGGWWGGGGCELSVADWQQTRRTNRAISNNQDRSPGSTSFKNFIAKGYTVTYPEDYQGAPINDTGPVEPETLTPDYSWKVEKDENGNGILTVTYMKNLPHFLTGISYLAVDKMTLNWENLDTQVYNESYQPAGWLDKSIVLPAAGYYMFNISHNQQLDSPPWPADSNYEIEQRYVQFRWDGSTTITGSTVGCTDGICNDEKESESPALRALNYLGVPIYGFQKVVFAPLDFISELPSAASNCMPLVLPLPYVNYDLSIPCLGSAYSTHFSSIITIYQTILVGLFSYYAGLRVFENIKGLSNPRDDRIETVKL